MSGRAKQRQYTQLGKRITQLCGTQEDISFAIGLDRAQVSRRLTGVRSFTTDELFKLAEYFKVPVWMFFVEPDMDGESLRDCHKMFLYDPVALDWILEAFRQSHFNLKQLGEIAEQLCKEKDDDELRSG